MKLIVRQDLVIGLDEDNFTSEARVRTRKKKDKADEKEYKCKSRLVNSDNFAVALPLRANALNFVPELCL